MIADLTPPLSNNRSSIRIIIGCYLLGMFRFVLFFGGGGCRRTLLLLFAYLPQLFYSFAIRKAFVVTFSVRRRYIFSGISFIASSVNERRLLRKAATLSNSWLFVVVSNHLLLLYLKLLSCLCFSLLATLFNRYSF